MKKINYSYSSPLAPYMNDYIKYYAAQGKKNNLVKFILRVIDQYLISIHHKQGEPITEDIYFGCLSKWDGCSDTTKYHNGTYIVAFFKYLSIRGIDCYVPRPPKSARSQYIPYIFSEDQVLSLFENCDKWRDRYYTFDSHALIMPALLRLLYSTGIRINEALSLKNRNVNINKRYILLEGTKNYKDRLAPINSTLAPVLSEYIKNRNRLAYPGINAPDSYFFITHSNRRCNSATVSLRFHAILKQMGLEYYNGQHGIRVHDLRHTACVHALVKMVRAGKDPYCCLPILLFLWGTMIRNLRNIIYVLLKKPILILLKWIKRKRLRGDVLTRA